MPMSSTVQKMGWWCEEVLFRARVSLSLYVMREKQRFPPIFRRIDFLCAVHSKRGARVLVKISLRKGG